ncbi:glycine zipper domain-containing protein [Azospirillum doebereinerae]|uniref:glycine zipper domain-containing protein n=1 Tax=Azospirillum doebereinerae TaxID=92933 RepID=UPI001EE5BEF6|nr:glycine zipper domain-containing protein [Azospirillum doebereinerae]MCG5241331.1 glycine zipper domain-containing protein [Azospirillum doebereinerae]
MALRGIRITAALTLVLFSAACTTTGSSSATLSPDQKALRDYSADYTVQGAVAGAVLGCVTGALLSRNRAVGCAAGAAVGGAAGGTGGYFLAQRQNQVGATSAAYTVQKSDLDGKVEESRQAAALSAKIASTAKADIRQLQRQVASGQASNAQLMAKVREAEQDRESMTNASKKMEDTIGKLETDINSGKGSKSDVAYMRTKQAQLVAEKRKLDATISDLAGVTGAGTGVGAGV